MKELLFLFLFVSAVFLFGCSSSHYTIPVGGVDSSEINFKFVKFGKIRGDGLKIELTDGRTMVGNNLEMNNDSAKWNDARSDTAFGIAANQIKTVSYNNHWSSALYGFGSGAVAGGTVGYILVGTDGTIDGDWNRLVGTVVFGAAGGILGGIGGLVISHKDEYEFVNRADSTKK